MGAAAAAALTSENAYQIEQQLSMLRKGSEDSRAEIDKTKQAQELHSINFYKHHQLSGKASIYVCVLRIVGKSSTNIIRTRVRRKRG